MTQGGLYFVTPTSRIRPLKVKVLWDFFATHAGRNNPDTRNVRISVTSCLILVNPHQRHRLVLQKLF